MSNIQKIAPTHKCSFCDKTNIEVKHIIAGPGVSICDECVLLCVEIMIKGDREEKKDESGV